MAIDYNDVKDNIAAAISSAVAQASGDAMAQLPVQSTGVTATWNATATVQIPDTSGLVAGNYIRTVADGNWYKITTVNPTNVVVEDTFSKGSFPSGGESIILSATLTWDGTEVVLASATGEVVAGDSIKLDSDGQWFRVGSVQAGTSFTILADGKTIPTGSTTSSKAGSLFTASPLPAPPDGSSLEDKIGYPIANPVVDDGIAFVQSEPHELPNYTVAQANAIPSPALGALIFVTNQSGGSVPAFYDGTNWRTVTTRSIIS